MPATPAWPPKSAPRLFIDEKIEKDRKLGVAENHAHYLSRVMRVAVDDTVILCDDATGEWAARVDEVAKREVWLTPVERLREREEVPDFWLCPALLKKDRFDLVLEKATELGVARIRPVITRRCVARKLNVSRAQAIVTEAAEQCARTALPVIVEPTPLDTLLRDWPADRALFFCDEEGGVPANEAFAASEGQTAVLIGPEGGFDDAERKAVRELPQAQAISLGPRILRGETAALAAIAVWMSEMGDWSK